MPQRRGEPPLGGEGGRVAAGFVELGFTGLCFVVLGLAGRCFVGGRGVGANQPVLNRSAQRLADVRDRQVEPGTVGGVGEDGRADRAVDKDLAGEVGPAQRGRRAGGVQGTLDFLLILGRPALGAAVGQDDQLPVESLGAVEVFEFF